MTGECYVEFGDEDEARGGQEEKNRERIGNRYIEIFIANKQEFERAKGGQVTQAIKGGTKGVPQGRENEVTAGGGTEEERGKGRG